MEQSPLCYAALEYIHSLLGAREEKRRKKCEKKGEELKMFLSSFHRFFSWRTGILRSRSTPA